MPWDPPTAIPDRLALPWVGGCAAWQVDDFHLERPLASHDLNEEPADLDEQAYRYNNRKDATDFDRCKVAAPQIVGKPALRIW